ncbi:MAG: hypothetical protein AAGJ46_21440 [Planctomycetota bacterium]
MKPSLSADAVRVVLDRPNGRYLPGEAIEVVATIDAEAAPLVAAAEVSLLWYTAGKGDEDLHVHAMQRVRGPLTAETRRLTLESPLPMSPHSYAGHVVKVCWCVRVRLFDGRRRQTVVETPLVVGVTSKPAGAA